MPKRSTRVTLSNNTPLTLTLVPDAVQLCHGQWTEGWQPPPNQIMSKTAGSWQSESHGLATGTEGWVKYELAAPPNTASPPPPELVYVHWDNPFVWGNGTQPSDQQVSVEDVTPACNKNKGAWDNGSFNPMAQPTHELFIAGMTTNNEGWTWGTGTGGAVTTIVLAWPALILLGITQLLHDINIEIVLGLRQKGSVDQTIFGLVDGAKGLRTVAHAAGQPSLRKLLAL
jgi:hypothetical protein